MVTDMAAVHDTLSYTWGAYLAQFDWTFAVTLTSRPGTSRQRLVREFRRTIHRLERECDVRWAYAIETSPGGINHMHALLWLDEPMPPSCLDQHWRLGHKSVRRYKPLLGAAFYLPKEFGRTPA